MNEERLYPATGNAHKVKRSGQPITPTADLLKYLQEYTREKPEVVAMWCVGIGFVLGWKLIPW